MPRMRNSIKEMYYYISNNSKILFFLIKNKKFLLKADAIAKLLIRFRLVHLINTTPYLSKELVICKHHSIPHPTQPFL